VEFALGILAALIGAGGAFAGAWLSGRHERQLEQERWRRGHTDAADDARAAAITELTTHLASATQTITWFTTGAEMRPKLFTEKAITDYDTEIRTHLTGTIQGLVAVAHRDVAAFQALEQLAREVWRLDWQVAQATATFWEDPEDARTRVRGRMADAIELEMTLPHRVVNVLRPDQVADEEQLSGAQARID
jgi:hypothetical protein